MTPIFPRSPVRSNTVNFKKEYKSILKPVYLFAERKGVKLYLVGGILRDIILKREKLNPDFDFCIKSGAINFGSKLAKEIRAGFVVLDKEHGACRLVKKINNKVATLDFSDFRGKDLEEDLLHRDFTINTFALELKGLFSKKASEAQLIDLHGASEDLKEGIIRIANKTSFDEDPLRVLRAFSLSAIFGFKIEPKTVSLIKIKTAKLSEVSFERLRDEIFKILGSKDSFGQISAMDDLGIIKVLFPEFNPMRGLKQGPYHHLNVWKHSLETLKQLEVLLYSLRSNKAIQDYLDEPICAERTRRSLLKLGCLLHDTGKPEALRRRAGKTIFHGHERIGSDIAEEIARRFKLSNDELQSLSRMVFWHLRPGYLADKEKPTPRAVFRYFRDAGKDGLSILLLSMADQRSTRGPLTSDESRKQHERVVLKLIKEYFRRQEEKERLIPVINGNDLIKKFKLEPSPLIGKILAEIEEQQAIGKIKNKTEALKKAALMVKNDK